MTPTWSRRCLSLAYLSAGASDGGHDIDAVDGGHDSGGGQDSDGVEGGHHPGWSMQATVIGFGGVVRRGGAGPRTTSEARS